MQTNSHNHIQNHQIAPMSSSHAYTAGVAVNQQSSLPEDDEDDICPVCESKCTCDNKQRNSIAHASNQSFSGSSVPESSHCLRPSLKIKLTVPPKLLARYRGAIIKSNQKTSPGSSPLLPQTGEFSLSDPHLGNHLLDPSVPKRRGRPPKVVVAAREAARAVLAAAAANSSPGGISRGSIAGISRLGLPTSRARERAKASLLKKKNIPAFKPKGKGTTVIKSSTSRRRVIGDRSYQPRGFSCRPAAVDDDDDDDDNDNFDSTHDEDDTNSLSFPTFISATDSSSSSSSSSDIDDSDTDDAELRMEEESHIVDSEQEKEKKTRHDKARVRRELFGESEAKQKGRSHHIASRWEIKPRRNSVAGSDADADVDMDVDTDDQSTEAEDDEPEGRTADDDDSADVNELDRNGRRKLGVSFAGVVTGWSDGEESSYDADLFFANLDGSDSDSDSTMTLGNSSVDADGEDGGLDVDQESGDDLNDAMSLVAAAGLDRFPFDFSTSWDDRYVFSSALEDLDVDMATDLRPLPTSNRRRRHRRRELHSPDVDLVSSSLLSSDEEAVLARRSVDNDADTEEEYEYYNGVDLTESDGETTEDELIGEDGLPNARAMMIFRWPASVSSVNPMNTLSPASRSMDSTIGNPNPDGLITRDSTATVPSTVLSTFDESEEIGDTNSDQSFDSMVTLSRREASRVFPKVPTSGFFDVATDLAHRPNRAIIDGRRPELPSPYPRSKSRSRLGSQSRHRNLRDRSSSISGKSSILEEDIMNTPSQSTDSFAIESMDLDDVLHAAFLASDPTADAERPSDEQSDNRSPVLEAKSDADTDKHLNSLDRWNRIPMATFRRTRQSSDDTGGWCSSTHHDNFYAAAIRNTPLRTIAPPQTPKQRERELSSGSLLGSPLALRGKDGASSNIRNIRNFQSLTEIDRCSKSEKERKDEKKRLKMALRASNGKGKSYSPQHPPTHPRHYHHQHHQHYPNSKSRASSSMQRNTFNSSSFPLSNA